ncbi:unnamed protein product [Didymodactylos carnosus]|uniref:Chromatin target of PRMT1 protein C-terminal domain-containing protein n=1 Tax=Didymodactylos carnosus TaxID=1234261 RepID=A0A813PVW3_9BILA|nr:unnamed protein product [Didymodactylos carnosus]CAF0771841.1 unnamed protein product [Didymodactylos carnosus]CAF3537292.1 unnamed protein product [Didymodactylos carnosus]CAF3552679.1 unnamed protein product [Didymodactylos carnosus]
MTMSAITGKIVLRNATKVSLDRRFGDIAKQTPRYQANFQPHVTIPNIRDEIFQQKRASANERRQDIMMRNRPAALDIANRLKKRSISYRLGRGFGNYNRGGMGRFNLNQRLSGTPRIIHRIGFGRGRRIGGSLFSPRGANRSPRGGGLMRGRERIGVRNFRGRFNRGFNNRFNNNNLQSNQNSERNSFQSGRGRGTSLRGSRGNRGSGNNIRGNSNRGVGNFRGRGRGRGGARNSGNNKNQSKNNNNNSNDNNTSITKEKLDSDLDFYMSQTKIDDGFDITYANGSN